MEESYIRDYQIKLLEDTYYDDLERLKALYYGLEYILNGMENNIETNDDKYNYNKLTTCLLTMQKIIEEEDKKQTIPSF